MRHTQNSFFLPIPFSIEFIRDFTYVSYGHNDAKLALFSFHHKSQLDCYFIDFQTLSKTLMRKLPIKKIVACKYRTEVKNELN